MRLSFLLVINLAGKNKETKNVKKRLNNHGHHKISSYLNEVVVNQNRFRKAFYNITANRLKNY
jgi:hypothetical protein